MTRLLDQDQSLLDLDLDQSLLDLDQSLLGQAVGGGPDTGVSQEVTRAFGYLNTRAELSITGSV